MPAAGLPAASQQLLHRLLFPQRTCRHSVGAAWLVSQPLRLLREPRLARRQLSSAARAAVHAGKKKAQKPDDLQRAARRLQSGSSCNAPRSMRGTYKHWQRRAAGGRAAQGVRHGQHHCQVRAPDKGAALHRALATSWACQRARHAAATLPERATRLRCAGPAAAAAGRWWPRARAGRSGTSSTARAAARPSRSSCRRPRRPTAPRARPSCARPARPTPAHPPCASLGLPPLCGAGCCVAVRSRGRRAGPGLVGSWTPRPGQTRCREGLRAAGLCCGRLVADPALDNLLHLHARPRLCGKGGAAGSPATGSAGPLCALGTLPEGLSSAAL